MYKVLSVDFDWILSPNQWLDLNKLILSKVDKAQVLGFIKQHHHILPYLKPQTHLTNVDHHHDIFYDNQYKHMMTEGNWLGWCIKDKRVVGLNWIGNTNSRIIEGEMFHLQDLEEFDRSITLDSLKDQEFDTIVFVESQGYQSETKNVDALEYFMPWHLTKQYIEKYHPEKIVSYKTNHITKYFNNV